MKRPAVDWDKWSPQNSAAIHKWRQYRDAAYGHETPLAEHQEVHCSLAFFHGMLSAFDLLVTIAKHQLSREDGKEGVKVFQTDLARAVLHTKKIAQQKQEDNES
jgi:hypothetical protein